MRNWGAALLTSDVCSCVEAFVLCAAEFSSAGGPPELDFRMLGKEKATAHHRFIQDMTSSWGL
jgi:hypothetical protein